MVKSISLMLVLTLLFTFELFSQALFQPHNLNFEKGRHGYKPPSWTTARKLTDMGMVIVSTDEEPAEGKLCLMLYNPLPSTNPDNLDENSLPAYQVLDAIPYRNKKIKLSASARLETDDPFAKGELWAIGRSTKEQVTFSEYQNNKIENDKWARYEIIFDVPTETNELRIGALLRGSGKFWVDDFKIEVIQPEGTKHEPAKELTDLEIKNLKAFANIYGYLNFFNPANSLSNDKSDALTLWAVANAEKQKNYKELTTFLSRYSKLISPVSSVTAVEDKKLNYNKPSGSIDFMALAKMHKGGPVDRPDDIFSSQSVNIFSSLRQRESSAIQVVDALKFKGKKIKISASIKVEQASPGANAQIWARADRIGRTEYEASTSADNPVMSKTWKKTELTMELPLDIHVIKLALVFIGEGKAFFDDVRIDVIENGKKQDEILVYNPSFETIDKSGLPEFWSVEDGVFSAGYKVYADSTVSSKGKFSLVMESDMLSRVTFPVIGKIYNQKIADNIFLNLPYVYYGNDSVNLPIIEEPDIKIIGKPEGYFPTFDDRYTRIASVIKLWNILKHFNSEKINLAKLDSILTVSLKSASRETNRNNFVDLLRSMLLLTNDTRAIAWHHEIEKEFTFPFIIREFDNKILVSKIADSTIGINIGDELISIDGKPVQTQINEIARLIPGELNNFKMAKILAEIRAGDFNTESKLTFKKVNGENYNIKVHRSILLSEIYEERPPEIAELDSGYVYIDLTGISDKVIKDYITQLSYRDAFIFDLRGFSTISEYFLSLLTLDTITNATWKIPVFTFPDNEVNSALHFGGNKIPGNGKLAGKKYVFLVDDRTSGYAEAIASIAKSNKIGTIIGKPTSANAGETMAFRLFGGFAVSFSGLKVISPDGTVLFGNPVKPDIKIEYELDNSAKEYDNLIQKALEILKN